MKTISKSVTSAVSLCLFLSVISLLLWITPPAGALSNTVTFMSDDSIYTSVSVVSGDTVNKPADPTKAGYSFGGWYTDGGLQITFPYTVTADITLYAKWTAYLTYTTSSGTGLAIVTGYTGAGGAVEIPDTITVASTVYTVREIDDDAFNGETTITSVKLPNNVQVIGNSSFLGCTALKSVTFPANPQITTIPTRAFYGCTALESISIPSGVSTIDLYAFYGCTALSSAAIPASVAYIRDYAFDSCTNLSSVTFENTSVLDTIGGDAFGSCTSLHEITLPIGVAYISEAFSGSGLTSIIIPSSVLLMERAFYNCAQLSTVTYADTGTLTSIDSGAFLGCTSLSEITIPDYISSIGSSSFLGCTALTSITIPQNITSIGEYAFTGCTTLSSVTFETGSTLESIGESAFSTCTALTSFSTPDNVTALGSNAFKGCSKLGTAYFYGSLPTMGTTIFANTKAGFTVYYHISHASSWSSFTAYTTDPFCILTLDLQDGSTAASNIAVLSDTGLLSAPVSPIRTDYTFGGWYYDAACSSAFLFDTEAVTDDIILYARWMTEFDPTITIQPSDTTAYTNQEATVSIEASADTGTLTYQWYQDDGTLIIGATDTSYSFTKSTPGVYMFYCIVTNTVEGITATVTSDIVSVTFVAPLTLDSITPNKASPQSTGTTIRWTTAASGAANPQYNFVVYKASTVVYTRGWSTTSYYDWTPTEAGTDYRIRAYVRETGSTATVSKMSGYYTVTAALALNTITPSKISPQAAGTTIRWTAAVSGATIPQYNFAVYKGATVVATRGWSTTAYYDWTPTDAGTDYRIRAYVRETGSTAYVSKFSDYYTINAAVLVSTISPNKVSPQLSGTTIRWTATVAGVSNPQYNFSVYKGTVLVTTRGWSATSYYDWKPTEAGTDYRIRAYVRETGSTAYASKFSSYYTITAGLSINTITPNKVSPQVSGTVIRWTATASGAASPQYNFAVYKGTTVITTRGWSTASYYDWTPTEAGTDYRIRAYVRETGSTAYVSMFSDYYTVSAGLAVSSLTPNKVSPQASGSTIRWTAAASGATTPQYNFAVYKGATLVTTRGWSTANTFDWTPTEAGSDYRIRAYVRETGTTAYVSLYSDYYTIN